MMVSRYLCIALMMLAFAMGIGCSGATTTTSPEAYTPQANGQPVPNSHYLWGLWQFVADPDEGTLDVVRLREGNFHLNALVFLEPPPLVNLTLESVKFNGNVVEADIGLRHPFMGLTEFTGFDVCGILITKGSVSGFTDTALVMAGENNTRLLNPDGYSRWWNPAEFPVNNGTMFSYKDGLLGSPHSTGNYNSTMNAYKYFCDDLTNPNDPLSNVTLAKRGMFSAGKKNVRHYTIKLGTEGLVFNYAVDANWQFPQGGAPWTAPDDFGPNANRVEPWRVKITEVENTLWNDGTDKGGNLNLRIDVYDWFDAGANTVRLDSPGNFPMIESATPIGGGGGYSTYEIEIIDATPVANHIDILISCITPQADFAGYVSGTNTTSYFTYSASVSPESPASTVMVNFDPEQDLETSHWMYFTGAHEPRIIQKTSGQLVTGWMLNSVYSASGSTHPSRALSDDKGLTWSTTWQNPWAGYYCANCKICLLDHNNLDRTYYGYVYYSSTWSEYSWSQNFVSVPDTQGGDLFGQTEKMVSNGLEFVWTMDGFPVYIRDYSNVIRASKGTSQDSPQGTSSGVSWYYLPDTTVYSGGFISDARSIAKQLTSPQPMYFAFFGSSSSDAWIRLAKCATGDGLTWDTSTVVWDGASQGYNHAGNPGFDLLSDGRAHFVFLRQGLINYELVHCGTNNVNGSTFTLPTVIDSSTADMTFTDVDTLLEFGMEIVVVVYEKDDDIFIAVSPDAGETWEAPVQVNGGAEVCYQPDFIIDADGYAQIVYIKDVYNPNMPTPAIEGRVYHRRADFALG